MIDSASDYSEEVKVAVCARLAQDGWVLVERLPFQPPGVGRMGLALVDGFVATVDVLSWLDEGDDDVCDRWRARVALGIDYAPAREITAALAGSVHSGVLLREPSLTVDLVDERDVGGAAQALMRFARAEAPGLVRVANVDAIVDLLREGQAVPAIDDEFLLDESELSPLDTAAREGAARLLIATLLASAGEYKRALPVLAELHDTVRSEHRLVRQLNRFVGARGALALPTSAPEWPPQWLQRKLEEHAPPDFVQVAIKGMSRAAILEQAVTAVRRLGTGKTRAELRRSLVAELGSSAAEVAPVQVERAVERLVAEQGLVGKVGGVRRATAALKDLIEARGAATPEPFGEDLVEETWWELPAQAAFPIRPSAGPRAAVHLNATARQFFDRMAVTVANVWDSQDLDAWLTHNEEYGAEPGGRLGVHVGQQLVGWLDCALTSRFEAALEAAAQRDEAPYVRARLTRIPDKELAYLLDLALPEEMPGAGSQGA